MKAEDKKPIDFQAVLLGLGSLIVTIFMTSGKWDIFDFGLSGFIILICVYFMKINNMKFKSYF